MKVKEKSARLFTHLIIQFGIKITTFDDKSSFLKIIGDAFRKDYVCSLSSHLVSHIVVPRWEMATAFVFF